LIIDTCSSVNGALPAGTLFTTNTPKRELIEDVVKNQIIARNIDFDQNYLSTGAAYPALPERYETIDDTITGFIAVSAPGVSFFRHVTDHNANLAWVRITNIPDREDGVISMVVARWHDNVRVFSRKTCTWIQLRTEPISSRDLSALIQTIFLFLMLQTSQIFLIFSIILITVKDMSKGSVSMVSTGLKTISGMSMTGFRRNLTSSKRRTVVLSI
jgi:hypothetical protein